MKNIIYITALWTILLASSCVEDECATAKECGPNQTCVESGGVLFGGKICADIDGTVSGEDMGPTDMSGDMETPDPDMSTPDMSTPDMPVVDMSTPDFNDMDVPDSGEDMNNDMATPDMEADMPCVPDAPQDICEMRGLNCGTLDITDNCGETRPIDCGVCANGETCGGGDPGIANVCGCTPETNAEFCARNGKDCGTYSGTDNCGNARVVSNCGSCSGGEVCGQSTANVCGCPCNIGGTCYADGAVNPANECQACRPGLSTTSWSNRVSGTSCDDGNLCTENDTCSAGVCGGDAKTCTSSNQCRTSSCNPSTGACVESNRSNGSSCNDGNACTQTDTCQSGTCIGANPVTCSDPGECRTASCNPSTGACVTSNEQSGTSCSDGNPCTLNDTCNSSGSCVSGAPRVCPQGDQCQTGVCNTSTGQCGVQNDPNGSPCNDGNACTQSDTCQSGTCVGAITVSCADPGQCRSASCNPSTGACVTTNDANGTPCSDGQFCTVSDSCTNGSCTGSPRSCDIQGVFCARVCNESINQCVKADPQCVEP